MTTAPPAPYAPPAPAPVRPPVVLLAPDGQTLRGRLHGRRQAERGWLYDVGVTLWVGAGADEVAPAEYRVWVPAPQVRPVSGADYGQVPTQWLDAGECGAPEWECWG
ncbi:hypothetical protein ABT160_34565 [Streptomyces sp. NPDC001941]|uniref:hypothetical protein n=1 Tax=Streptomyces sp. NPDC001941 TaxID=3154659 RepID=UPI00331FB886